MSDLTPCARCLGACCESVLLPPNLQIEPEWAAARGFRRIQGVTIEGRIIEAVELEARCPKLTAGGGCSIHETKPQVCRTYPVGGSACILAVNRRRTPDQAAWILEAMELPFYTGEQQSEGEES